MDPESTLLRVYIHGYTSGHVSFHRSASHRNLPHMQVPTKEIGVLREP